MKKLIFILSSFISYSLFAQITLKECIESGLTNRANIKSAKSEVFLANLKSIESNSKYLPQISLAYDYRYNPLIPTQIVPVGKFNPIPTDEVRAIKFGTNWQQNAGITIFQPIIDFTIKNKLKESKLNESLATIDLKQSQADLSFEIVKTYSQINVLSYQLDEAIADTLRSFQSYSIIRAKYLEGKVLKTELNTTLVNHNANITNFKKSYASLIQEKIYLHYLCNIPLERIFNESFAPIPSFLLANKSNQSAVQFESFPNFQKLTTKELLINQQIKTERTKYSPTISFQGYLGANQFSNTFNPFLNNYFGNSYLGISLKVPIFPTDKSVTISKQLATQLQIVNHQKEELIAETNKNLLQKNTEIERLESEIQIAENSVSLQSENVKLYQERLQNGRFTALELNMQETELQKLSTHLKQLKVQLIRSLIESSYISGDLLDKLNLL